MTAIRAENTVLWPQVWGLGLVQGAIALTWVIYNLYLVQLLQEFGFSPELATTLLIIESILAAVMEPLMGNFSDRAQHRLGTRFPFIALGVVLSSLFFLGIPIVLVGVNPAQVLRWMLPLMMVAWAIAMTVFRSPALSLLGRYALRTQMPLAASILTLVGGVAGAMAPLAGNFILGLGPLFAFFIGSITLLVAAGALRAVGCNQHITPVVDEVEEDKGSPPPEASDAEITESPSFLAGVSVQKLALIFGSGVGVTLGFRLMMQVFPTLVAERVPDGSTSLVIGSIFVSLALTAIPAGAVAIRLGMRRSIILGLSLMAVGCVVMLAIANVALAFGVAIALGAAFSLVSNATIPFALSMVPPQKAGLGTGMYFSGGAAASSLYGLVIAQWVESETSLAMGAVAGAIAFLMAATCVGVSTKTKAV